jgi:hypothetical protein
VLPLDVEATYDFLVSPLAFQLFTGWGPIPGIDRLEWKQGDPTREGSVATVHNTDGSTHTETIVLAQRPTLYGGDIEGFSSAFRFLTAGATERWGMTPVPEGTRIERTFRFRLRSPLLWPLGAMIGAFFRKAVTANHEAMIAWAEAQRSPPAEEHAA